MHRRCSPRSYMRSWSPNHGKDGREETLTEALADFGGRRPGREKKETLAWRSSYLKAGGRNHGLGRDSEGVHSHATIQSVNGVEDRSDVADVVASDRAHVIHVPQLSPTRTLGKLPGADN
jgi:hypothetical protein